MNITASTPYLSIIFNKKYNKSFLVVLHLISKNYISYYNINELSGNDYITFMYKVREWYKTNPVLPISIYYKNEFDQYDYCKHYMFTSDCEIIDGYEGINLKNIVEKRIKRKIINIE